jgi:hypothetical protein
VRPRALALVALVALAVASPAAAAPEIGGFGAHPAHFDAKIPATRAYFVREVAAGGSFHDEVAVTSSSNEPIELSVYPVDGLTGTTSGAVYANKGSLPTETGRWIAPKVTHVTLQPGKTTLVPFTVSVPRGAAPGDHLGGIAFQRAGAERSSGTFSVTQVLRAVVGVLVQVPGAAAFQPELRSLGVDSVAGTNVASVVVGLDDTGRKLGKTRLTVSLTGPDGYRRRVTRRLDTILPGDAIRYPLVWPDALQPGAYTVTATAAGGSQPVTLRRQVQLGTPLVGSEPQAVAPAAGGGGLPWWTLLVAVAGGAALAAGGVGYGRRHHRRLA